MFKLEGLFKAASLDPVQVNREACLHAEQRRPECRACVDACPASALAFGCDIGLDRARCSGCGLCAAACPTSAVAVRGIDEQAVLASPTVHCARVSGEGVAVPCLGWLTMDHLVDMQLRHSTVTLTSGNCDTCPLVQGGWMVGNAVAMAAQTLMALGRRDVVHWNWAAELAAAGPALAPEREPASFDSGLFRPAKAAALSERVPVRRRRWVKRVHPDTVPWESRMPTGPWRTVIIGDTCTGCGLCATLCPTGAMHQESRTDHWVLRHQPAACLSCETCQANCPLNAIHPIRADARSTVAGDVIRVAMLLMRMCRLCGREFLGQPPEEECPDCRMYLRIR